MGHKYNFSADRFRKLFRQAIQPHLMLNRAVQLNAAGKEQHVCMNKLPAYSKITNNKFNINYKENRSYLQVLRKPDFKCVFEESSGILL